MKKSYSHAAFSAANLNNISTPFSETELEKKDLF